MSYKDSVLWGVLSLITFTSFSQAKQYHYYFDKEFNSVAPPKSFFNGSEIYKNGLYELRLYSTLNKNLAFIEYFMDSSLHLRDELNQPFYTDLSKESHSNYLKTNQEVLWQQQDSLGHKLDSSIYDNGEKILEVHFGYYNDGVLESFILNNIKMNQLLDIYYDESANVVREVNFTGENILE